MRKVLALLLLALMMACQTTSPPPIIDPTPDPNPNSVSININASDGGEVKLENGVSLNIPVGALGSNTKVTVQSVSPPQDNTDPAMAWAENSINLDLGDAELNTDLELSFPIPQSWQVEVARARAARKIACWTILDDAPPIVFATRDEEGRLWLQKAEVDLQANRVVKKFRPIRLRPLPPIGIIIIRPPKPTSEPIVCPPIPTPDPFPTPDPDPQPQPDPTPYPDPQPDPQPNPVPDPMPLPEPIPNPNPVPDPVPNPLPVPPPPNPIPNPIPNPLPLPNPVPLPNPIPVPPPPPPPPNPDNSVLQVPFYQQSTSAWCVPTSLSMVMNYHQPVLGGIVSNWRLAASNNQAIMQTTWQHLVMQNAGVPANQYFWLRWDADLIPSNAFTNFVRLSVAGFNPFQVYGAPFPNRYLAPRPVELGSFRLGHAFVAVGANRDYIWLHDSAPVFASLPSIAVWGTWQAFRQRVIDRTQTAELITLTMMPDAKPENQRRGSIVLQEQDNDYPEGSSFVYRAQIRGIERDVSRWQWNGSQPNTFGYYWDDPLGVLPNTNSLGNNFVRVNGTMPGKFVYLARAANITKIVQTYTMTVRLMGVNGELKRRDYQLRVPPYSWYNNASTVRGEFNNLGIAQAGAYTFDITLWQAGILQDTKQLSFVVQ